jgi:hypothetical protein
MTMKTEHTIFFRVVTPIFTEPTTQEKREIDEWILSFPRHQNNDPPLSGSFA